MAPHFARLLDRTGRTALAIACALAASFVLACGGGDEPADEAASEPVVEQQGTREVTLPGTEDDPVKAVLAAYPEAIKEKDKDGELPQQLAAQWSIPKAVQNVLPAPSAWAAPPLRRRPRFTLMARVLMVQSVLALCARLATCAWLVLPMPSRVRLALTTTKRT